MAEKIVVYTIKDLTELLHAGKRSIYRWIAEGKLKATKIGRTWIITQEALKEFLERGTKR